MLGRLGGCGAFVGELGVPDCGSPQGQALGVPLPECIPLSVSHAFEDPDVHTDAPGADFLVPGGRVRGIDPYRWFRWFQRLRYDRGRLGRLKWRIRHHPPEPQPRPDASPRTAPADPHTGVDVGCLAAR